MEIYTKKLCWNTGKQDQGLVTGDEKTSEKSKQKRKAPSIPTDHRSKLLFTNANKDKNLSLSYSSSASTPGGESWTSSSGTDYTPSSYASSSTSGSALLEDDVKPLSVKNVNVAAPNDRGFKRTENDLNGFSENSQVEDLNSTYSVEKKTQSLTENIDTSKADSNNFSNISDYVENAILSSSNANLYSSSPNKSGDRINEVGLSHLPPRLTSFESSSTLNHDGLLKSTSETGASSNGGFSTQYVSLDFVRSAAQESRLKRRNDDTDMTGSNSSLSSGLISSVDSQDGSTIGSDIVENLYNKITAATARHNLKNLNASSDAHDAGSEIKLLPALLFSSRRYGNKASSNETAVLNNADCIRLPDKESTSDAKVNSFLQKNFSSNNSVRIDVEQPDSLQRNSDESTPPFNLHVTDSIPNNVERNRIQKCKNCFGVIANVESCESEELAKARKVFGDCSCAIEEEPNDVTEIDFCSSNLKEVPKDIGEYAKTLTKLLLESNTITELPQELFVCQQLQYLSVSDNDVTVLPPSLASLINLVHLDVSKNVIEDVPECIRCCKNLEVLDASVNPIEKLSEGFTQLISLRELYMNDCFFDFLPANFGRMSQLCVLELRDNQLQILPKSIRRLSQLKRLDLGGNIFQEWPDVISKLTNLSELWLDCNELAKVPCDIGDLTKLTYLDLSRNFLEEIPSQIGSLEHLTDLLLSENSLKELPDSIGFLHQLTIMNIELNQIANLPESIGKLSALEELDASHNKLETLPASIGNLKNIKTLLLDDNKLKGVPQTIGKCTEINILQLSRNQIALLPNSIGDLTNLKVLNICQNRIPYLPITMKKPVELYALWISPNQSKPVVPLHVEVLSKEGLRILTNILFPQEDPGLSRARKVLGTESENNENSYANDAADDDDLEAYAQRERGKTHVYFNLDATTYSNEVLPEGIEVEQMDDYEKEQPLSRNKSAADANNQNQAESSKENQGFSKDTMNDRGPFLDEYIVDIPVKPVANGLSVVTESTKVGIPQNFSKEKPMVKTADVRMMAKTSVSEHSSSSLSAVEIQTVSSVKNAQSQVENENNQGKLESGINDSEMRTWSSHSNLPTALTEDVIEGTSCERNVAVMPTNNAKLDDTFIGLSKPIVTIKSKPKVFPKPKLSLQATTSSISSIPMKTQANHSNHLTHVATQVKKDNDVTSRENVLNEREQLTKHGGYKPTEKQQSTEAAKNSLTTTFNASFARNCSATTSNNVQPLAHSRTVNGKDKKQLSFNDNLYSDGVEDFQNSKKTVSSNMESFNDSSKKCDEVERIATSKFSFADRKDHLSETDKAICSENQFRKVRGEEDETAKITEQEQRSLSPESIEEGKSSSVTSGESMPATDRDSGVGNDVESQESIPDFPDEHNDIEIDITLVTSACRDVISTASPPTYDIPITCHEKGRWHAVAREDSTNGKVKLESISLNSDVANAAHIKSTHVRNPKYSQPTSNHSFSSKNVYVPTSTIDSTTVTYSHDYNVSKARSDRSSLSNESTKSRVAKNVKRFEKFFENGVQLSESPEEKYKSLPARYNVPDEVTNSNENVRDTPFAKTSSAMQRVEANSSYRRLSSDNVFSSNATNFRSVDSVKPLKSLSGVQGEMPPSTKQVLDFKDKQEPLHVDTSNMNIVPTRRISAHMKKSKFEEALAATKHKHFRDKLEKMMQQQSPSVSSRLSRNSSSSISSLPRITSPVPYHNPTPLDRITADITREEEEHIYQVPRASKVNSLHSRLKEKLQTVGSSNQPNATNALSRQRPGSSRQFTKDVLGQKVTNETMPEGKTYMENKEPARKSIEEQLGQLLLDGSTDASLNQFIKSSLHPPALKENQALRKNNLPSQPNGSQSYNSRKHPMPDDWKRQLLQHIERKKQEKGQPMSALNSHHVEANGHYVDSKNRARSPHYLDAVTAPPKPLSTDHHNAQSNMCLSSYDAGNSSRAHALPRTLGTTETVPNLQEKRNRQSLSTEEERGNHFIRGSGTSSSKHPGGRRSSGRFLRTRTPGPEMTQTETKPSDLAPRPKSAMDMPTSKAEFFDHPQFQQTQWNMKKVQSKPQALVAPPAAAASAAPPSYEDHILRRVAAAASAQDYHDYVNVEYVDHLRAAPREKHSGDRNVTNVYDHGSDRSRLVPVRSAGSNGPDIHVKNEKQYAYDAHSFPVDNPYQPHPLHKAPFPVYHTGAHASKPPYRPEPENRSRMTAPSRQFSDHESRYGNIPPPIQTRRKYPKIPPNHTDRDATRSINKYDDDYYYLKQNRGFHDQHAYLPPSVGFNDNYDHVRRHLPSAARQDYEEREDESVASAFRPYHHQQQSVRPQKSPLTSNYRYNQSAQSQYKENSMPVQHHKNNTNYHKNHHQPVKSRQQKMDYMPARDLHPSFHGNQYVRTYDEDVSVESDPSLSGEPSQQWREVDAAVELITVTVRKNPTFGFHIMGGIDAGGNPYRHDDDGVFITYVAPGGAADGHVQPGDKILLVNGSDFVGITHKRAVELLRNAGHVAVLAVERLVGRPV